MSDAAIIADPRALMPLPPALQGAACSTCNKLGARWRSAAEDHAPVCALCVLYRTPWGKRIRASLDALIDRIHTQEAMSFSTDVAGALVRVEDADRVLLSIAVMSRMGAVRAKRQA